MPPIPQTGVPGQARTTCQTHRTATGRIAGPLSPRQDDYPAYVSTSGENARGRHALMVLEGNPEYEHQINASDALSPSQQAHLDTHWHQFRCWWEAWPGASD